MYLSVLFGLLKKIPYQLWLLVGVLLTFWLYGVWQYQQGQKDVQDKWDESRKLGQAIVEDLKLRANAVITVVEHRVTTETKVIRERGDVIIKEVPIYIPADTPDLPGGFRLLHDAAATSTLPERSRLPSAEAVRVEDVTVTLTQNYGQCNEWRTQLLGWQEWYRELSLAWQIDQHK